MRSSALRISHDVGLYAASEREFVMAGKYTPRDGTAIGAIYCHGAASDATNVKFYPPAVELAKRGLIVMGIDAGGTFTWNNDTALARISDAKTRLQSALGAKAGKIVMLGGSMGSGVALTWTRANLASVYCTQVALPICDLEDVRANDRNSYKASIETAYTNNAGWQAARPTHNPIEFADELAGIPIRLDYSDTDTIGLPSFVPDFLAAVGDSATSAGFGSVGHSLTGWDGIDAAAFVAAAAGVA